jgi:energy-coupling factor transporter ATP-binding protein EcfA2
MPKPIEVAVEVELPEVLRPYEAHGLDLSGYKPGLKNVLTDCPFCGNDRSMSLLVASGVFRCYKCTREGSKKGGGNIYIFLRDLWALGAEQTTEDQLRLFAKERGLLSPETLRAWGAIVHPLTGEWCLPGYSPEGVLRQLYRYAKLGDKYRLLATPGLPHQLHGTNAELFDADKAMVYVCEGPWDAMALWEVAGKAKPANGALVQTGDKRSSLLGSGNVLAVPGCSTFLESWRPMFKGKSVVFLYDNDHPKPNKTTGKLMPPVGFEGVKRHAGHLLGEKEPPAQVQYLRWGNGNEDFAGFDPALPSGYDIRDALKGDTLSARIARLAAVTGRIEDVPEEWREKAEEAKAPAVEVLPCKTYAELLAAWEKAMRWTFGLDHALVSMLAATASVMVLEDQLWLKIIGPASCGKSTLCEALSTARKYVYPKSKIRGFHSGFKSDAAGQEDNSLIDKINGKALVTKDGDTLIQSENLGKILSEGRDLYDCTSRSHYLNKMGKDYENVRTVWLLCGTSALRVMDQSELGERFLDCVIMDGIDPTQEMEVLKLKARQVNRNTNFLSNGSAASNQDPDKTRAMGMTGGYVSYLRENAAELLSTIDISEEDEDQIIAFALFVAHMRARPSARQHETAEREFAARLLTQLMKYAKMTAMVLNKTSIDDDVMERTKRIALDTARGITFDVCRYLFHNPNGLQSVSLANFTGHEEYKIRELLRFMRRIDVVESFSPEVSAGGRKTGVLFWKLTDRLQDLWSKVDA